MPGVVTIAAITVAIGLLPLPYGYYTLLRLFLCGVRLYFLASVLVCATERSYQVRRGTIGL